MDVAPLGKVYGGGRGGKVAPTNGGSQEFRGGGRRRANAIIVDRKNRSVGYSPWGF